MLAFNFLLKVKFGTVSPLFYFLRLVFVKMSCDQSHPVKNKRGNVKERRVKFQSWGVSVLRKESLLGAGL